MKSESVKRVQFESEDDSDTEQSNLAVRVLNRKSDYSSWQKTVETRLQKTDKDIGEIKTDVSKILQAVSYGTRNNRANSPSRSPVGRSDLCYRCNEKGHFARDCKNPNFNNRSRSPSPLHRETNQALNGQGSRK